jgi:uncharacterized membrane protein
MYVQLHLFLMELEVKSEGLKQLPTRRWIDRIFILSMWIKGIDGFFEVIGGLLLLITTPDFLHRLTNLLVAGELGEDSTDIIARTIQKLGHELGAAYLVSAAYLLTHGVVKLVIVTYLLRRNLRVYPWALAFLSLFAVYQGYLTLNNFSLLFLLLTLFDGLVVALVWYEYRHLRASRI